MFQIITDSTSDIPQKLVEETGVHVIPMTFVFGGHSYRNYPDNREMEPKTFFDRLRAGESATTNQIIPAVFLETFESFLKAGTDVLYIGFSSALSGTYSNAVLAASELTQKYPSRKIFTVDSLAVSLGEALLVYYAAQKQRMGASLEETRDWAERNVFRLSEWFTVSDLNHLKRGGRLSGAAALFGTVLNIKPVIHITNEGTLLPTEKVRGRRASMDFLVSHMAKTIIQPEQQTLFIVHGDCEEDAKYLAHQVKSAVKPANVVIGPLGPVIGSHTGPDALAIFFLASSRE